RPQAARPRAGDQARLGRRPPTAAADQALLRPLHAGDLRRRLQPARRRPRPRSRLPRGLPRRVMAREGSAGDLAIVLHSHMPYVEGFGTYPFGEEWLFDAVIRSYLPVLEMARDLTMTVTPVLADQLEDAGAAERLRRFLVEWRIGAAEADLAQVPEECRAACEGERRRYSHALELLDAAGGDPLAPFRRAAAEGRIALAA